MATTKSTTVQTISTLFRRSDFFITRENAIPDYCGIIEPTVRVFATFADVGEVLQPSRKKKIGKLAYVHANPSKRGLVKDPKDWPWSSYAFWPGDWPRLTNPSTGQRRTSVWGHDSTFNRPSGTFQFFVSVSPSFLRASRHCSGGWRLEAGCVLEAGG